MTKFNLHKFLERENLTVHRFDGLVSFDYNKTITFTMDWDEITINARGIVFEESTGKLVAFPYRKFWNKEELDGGDARSAEMLSKLPAEYHPNFEGESMILEKADGSCAIVFYYNGKWYVKTRGSFVSEQALWASAYLHNFIDVDKMNKDHTYLFEIIYPQNRIVVDYGDKEALVLTGIIDTATQKEFWYDYLVTEAEKIGSDVVKAFVFEKFEDIFKAREQLTVNEEGFVITFRNGYKFKLKGEAYCNVHRKMCAVTPLHFWRELDTDTLTIPDDFLADLPEEFRHTVDELKYTIESLHQNLYNEVVEYAKTVPHFENDVDGRRDRFFFIQKNIPKDYIHYVLSYLNGNLAALREAVHKAVRPNNNTFTDERLKSMLARVARIQSDS